MWVSSVGCRKMAQEGTPSTASAVNGKGNYDGGIPRWKRKMRFVCSRAGVRHSGDETPLLIGL